MTTSSRPFDAVLTDLDGVIRLFDHSELNRLERAAGLPAGRTMGVAFHAELRGPLLLGQLAKAEWRARIVERLAQESAAAAELAAAFTTAPFRADPAVVALLRAVREHVPVVVVTNATLWLDADLAAIGLTGLADAVVNSAVVGAVKPEERIYRIAAEQAGAAVERCLFVDDTAGNVAAARALGMTGVEYREPADLRNALSPLLN
ncbi:HAD-IA family hydrolase [Kitasatospora sp. RB6PN24]|uniref:HAD family hydrolase n=1 Tax=Kitasatospora humi TaxID=2893891 RepID=UPI001E638EFF|nr:HAD-IA family hydrolase [Kitasatospora humi]MCC9311049.1 HAD-IA family hydrolase [Kitasatospora humi]